MRIGKHLITDKRPYHCDLLNVTNFAYRCRDRACKGPMATAELFVIMIWFASPLKNTPVHTVQPVDTGDLICFLY